MEIIRDECEMSKAQRPAKKSFHRAQRHRSAHHNYRPARNRNFQPPNFEATVWRTDLGPNIAFSTPDNRREGIPSPWPATDYQKIEGASVATLCSWGTNTIKYIDAGGAAYLLWIATREFRQSFNLLARWLCCFSLDLTHTYGICSCAVFISLLKNSNATYCEVAPRFNPCIRPFMPWWQG